MNDGTFVIATRWGDQVFKARTFCSRIDKDDRVIFTRSTGTCTWAEFFSLRNGKFCRAWCQ